MKQNIATSIMFNKYFIFDQFRHKPSTGKYFLLTRLLAIEKRLKNLLVELGRQERFPNEIPDGHLISPISNAFGLWTMVANTALIITSKDFFLFIKL